MKIKTRVSIVTVSMLIIAIAVTAAVSIVSIRRKAEHDIAGMRENRMAAVKQGLKDFVDLAYENVNTSYEASQDRDYLKQHYGERLKNMANLMCDSIRRNHDNAQNREYLETIYGHRLKNILEISESILNEKLAMVERGELALEDAQAQALDSISRIRYNNSGYIWINDTGLPFPKMLQHPTAPELNGQLLDDPKFNCALGRDQNLFRAAVQVCLEKGEGFVDYKWPKPNAEGGLTPDVPKLSFVKLYKPWDWVLGVGIYIDDAVIDAQTMSIEEVESMRYDEGSGYFWINSDEKPFPTMIMHPISPRLNGQRLDDPSFNRGDNGENIFVKAAELCDSDAGQGFLFYPWATVMPDGTPGPDKLKISFVKAYKPWNWIVGTGIYLDRAGADAKKAVMQDLKKMRYHNGEGYYWITDTARPYPNMIMHAATPVLDGARLDDPEYNCALGEKKENLFRAMVTTALEAGEGFVDYDWPKPGSVQPEPKLSYVRLFKPWGWVIGTGVYVDHIYKEIALEEETITAHVNALIMKILAASFGLVIVAVIGSLVFARSLSAPILHLIKTMKDVDIETMTSSQIKLQGAEEIRELGGIFNGMLTSIHEAVEQLTETTAIKEKMESELNVAREIQMSIIPKLFPAFPERPEFEVFATLETAKAVGGDLYNFFFVGDDKLCFAVGDVSGKGVPASLFMAVTQTLLRAKTAAGLSAGEIMSEVNRALCIDNEKSMFATMFFCILDIKSGLLEYTNAGHNPPYIIRNQQSVENVTKIHGMPLGAIDLSPYENDSIQLNPGDSILLYSDGVTEAMNSELELFGEDRLEAVLEECKMQSPKGTVDLIKRHIARFVGDAEQHDDITILCLNYRG